jgi:hypothetical protein
VIVAVVVYILCAVTSLACALLLLRSYRRNRVRLLLWSGLCFVGLALNNIMLVIDTHMMTDVDLSIVRTIPAVLGVATLVYGLIWDSN